MKSCPVILFVAYIASSLAYGQDSTASASATLRASDTSPSSTLKLMTTVRLPLTGSLVGKARCDFDGNLYLRVMDAETSKKHHATSTLSIQKIGPDASLAGTFRISDVPPDLYATDFFVTDSGKVYEAAHTPGDGSSYVLKFAGDGSISERIPLEGEAFAPRQIAVFSSGEFLLSGTQGESGHTPFTAVFDRHGKLIKKVYEPEDEDSRKRAEAGDPDLIVDASTRGITSVLFGDVAAGSDGNVYLLRAMSPALIYVISPKGEVIRKFRVDSPSGLVAQRLKSAHGRLAISFLESYSIVGTIKVVDYQGNLIVSHSSEDQKIYPGLPGCYDSKSFTFISTDDQSNVYLHKAEPR